MIKSPYEESFNDLRVIAMMETEPMSNSYAQIMLTKEQKLQMLNLLESFFVHPEEGGFIVPALEVPIFIEDVKDDYTQAEIDV